MSKSRLRRTIGMLKYKVLDCWPYKFKQMRAAKLRERFRPRAFELPQIPAPDSVKVEIHMLCGKKQLDMGVWASWSILRFMSNAILYVHSDGTLQDEDYQRWRQVIPNALFISKNEADIVVKSRIASSYPRIYNWRCNNWCGGQVIDIHLFGQSDRLISMDSDVLCFKEPIELLKAVSNNCAVFRWNKDLRTAYSQEIEVLNAVTGIVLPESLNAGFLLAPRFDDSFWEHLEKALAVLENDSRVYPQHFWSAQTYYAICAARCPQAQALPDSYAVTLGRTSDDTVVRHYVGIPLIRHRYFTEGIPRLLRYQ